MENKIIDGKAHSQRIKDKLKNEIQGICSERQVRPPCLAVILVGNDPASGVYVRNKELSCQGVGMTSKSYRLEENTSVAQLEDLIHKLNEDDKIDGILLQLPLPKHLESFYFIPLIDPRKDVDGLTPYSQGLINWNKPGHRPCTPAGIIYLLKEESIPLVGASAVVIGRSVLVGWSVATLLQQHGATVTVIHSKSKDPVEIARTADVLVVAAGRPLLVKRDWIKPHATVVDVGIHKTEQGLVGDVDFKDVVEQVHKITPVPKGVGPMTIAMLLQNTFNAYKNYLAIG